MNTQEYQTTAISGNEVLFRDGAELEEALRNYIPDTAEEKRLVRKIDLTLLPMCVSRTNRFPFYS
jgi:hypothetical protein